MTTQNLSALVGSRICHDLISPLGAIGNGIELLTMSGMAQTPEMELISESVENANARIRLFRVAFGAPGTGQSIGRNEVSSILKAISRGGRVSYDIHMNINPERAEIQCVFLAIMCMEAAMPAGGQITISHDADQWSLAAQTSNLKLDDALWSGIKNPETAPKVSSAQVQFLLLPQSLADLGRQINVNETAGGLTLTF
jgi:histidine phosphotransferase ChpT